MNASAYLQKQGWRGLGYSLDRKDRGLAKPLLVSHKKDQAGLGTRKHEFENQWWLAALEDGLKRVGEGVTGNPASVLPHLALGHRQGLYSNFVKAETLASTMSIHEEGHEVGAQNGGVSLVNGLIATPVTDDAGSKERKKSKKRKHETADDVESDSRKKSKKRRDETSDDAEVNDQKKKKKRGEEQDDSMERKNKKEKKKGRKIENEMEVDDQQFGSLENEVWEELEQAPEKEKKRKEKREKRKSKKTKDEVESDEQQPDGLENETSEQPEEASKREKKRKSKKIKVEAESDHQQPNGLENVASEQPEEAPKREKKRKSRKSNHDTHDDSEEPAPEMERESEIIQTDVQEMPTEFAPVKIEQSDGTERQEEASQAGMDHTADFISLLPDDDHSGPVSSNGHISAKGERKPNRKEIRKEKKAEKTRKAAENARRNKEKPEKPEKQDTDTVQDDNQVEAPTPMPDPARELRYPLHPESIMALREQGQEVPLPGDRTDESQLRYMLINALENGRAAQCNKILKRALPTIDPMDPAQNGGIVPTKKISYKGEKYKREKTKRESKREAKHWVDVRANTHLFRPNGTYIQPLERGVTQDEIIAKRQADREMRQYEKIQKAAKRQLKEEMKTERRLARKRIRGEKKTKNHIEMQANISAKIQRQKREKDEAEAAAAGMTYDAFIEAREKEKVDKKRERDEQIAKDEGITYEELIEKRRKDHDFNERAAEAKKLGLSLEEYENQKVDFSDEEVGLDNPRGAASGMGQHHGRSPIDMLWEKHAAQTGETIATTELKSNSDSDSDLSSDSSSDESDQGGVSLNAGPNTDANSEIDKPATVNGGGSIPPDAKGNQLYVIDTIGNKDATTDPNKPKRVKDLTREERKARLEALRARRAERNAALGVTKMSKKERRKRRALRKQALLNHITNDLLQKKQNHDRQRAAERAELEGGSFQDSGVHEPASKQERNQMRRQARRIMRGVKKGTFPEEELEPQWHLRAGNKRPKVKGKGKGKGPGKGRGRER